MLRTFATTSAPGISAASSRPLVSLTEPLTPRSCTIIRDALQAAFVPSQNLHDPSETHAAVLVPFCNVDDQPGVLLEVRGKLRTHSGEVSFPGGRVDETDASPLAAALRETEEEVGVHPRQIQLLGRFGPAELSLGGMRVWPYVGFIRPPYPTSPEADQRTAGADHSRGDLGADMPLPSLPLASLTPSPLEVAHAFHLPLAALRDASRLRQHLFRGARPYYAIGVADLVAGPGAVRSEGVEGAGDVRWANDPEGRDEVGGGQEGRLEVWGLTGWYLCALMRILRVYEP